MTKGSEAEAASEFRLLIHLNRIGAVLSLGAAILFYRGAAPTGLPGPGGASHHEPLIVHFILAASLLFMASIHLGDGGRRRPIWRFLRLTSGPLYFAFAAINLLLAVRAGAVFGPTALPTLLFGVSSFLFGWTTLALLVPSVEDTSSWHEMNEEQKSDYFTERALERSLARPGATLEEHLGDALVESAALGAVIVCLMLSIPYYELLDNVIQGPGFEGWQYLVREWPVRDPTLLAYAIGLPIGWFLLHAGWSVFHALGQYLDLRRYPGMNRDLTADEIAFFRTSVKQLTNYADAVDEEEDDGDLTRFVTLSAIIGVVLFFAVPALLALFVGLVADLLEGLRTQGLDWALYVDDLGFGVLLLWFSAVAGIPGLWLLVVSRWGRVGIRIALGWWSGSEFTDDRYGHYRKAIALDVRRGIMPPDSEFAPEAFVQTDIARLAGNWLRVTGTFFALALVFLYLDRMDYDLFTEDYIETTDYWTSKAHRFGYGDVGMVDVACADDDDGLELSYRLEFAGGRTIAAVSLNTESDFRSTLPDILDAWTRVDAKLRAAGVPVRRKRWADGILPRPAFVESECREGLDLLAGAGIHNRVMPLLVETRGR